jgi:hypothetical protein
MNATIAASGAPFVDPTTNQPTKFCLYGDPTKSQTGAAGWVDGMNGLSPADRRFCLVTGPFTMAAGDTQELVVGLLGGLGADYLSSINVLKSLDDKAQSAYNSLFALPSPPAAPVVSIAALDGEIILSWGDGVTLSKTEGGVSQGFTFEGYNLYEFPGPSNTGGILLGTFDLVDGITTISDTAFDPTSGLNLIQVLQLGTDNDIIHSIDIKSSKVTNNSLVDGTPYYFGVTAYSYNANPPAAAGTHSLESSPSIMTIVPHSPNPGTRYTAKPGDSYPVTLTTAPGAIPSDGSVTATVVDQTKLTGDSYQVTFSNDPVQGTVWSLKDVTKSTTLISGQTNQSGDNHYPILDGMTVKVVGPPPGMKTWSIPSGARRFSPVGGAYFGLEGFSNAGDPNAAQDRSAGTIGMASNLSFGSIGTTLKLPTDYHDVLIKWAKVDSLSHLWDPRVVQADTNYSYAYRYLRAATADPTTFVPPRPEFLPFIVTKASGYPYQDYLPAGVPFSAWDMSYTPPRRLAVGHFENNQANGLVDGRYWPALTTVDNSAADGPREMCFIFSSPYTTTPVAPMNTNMSGNATTPMMWVLTCARRNDPPYPGNDQFLITANKVNTTDHTFSFASTKQVIGDAAAAKLDVTKANVFPNPYFGFNPLETNKFARFVTFNHLPPSATIRIFTLSGTMVRTIIKSDPSQFIQWDLNNEKGFPVAAGMYIVYIDMHDLGTKTLKLGVIPEQQYLDRW